MHLTGGSLNQIFEEAMVILTLITYTAVLLLRFIFDTRNLLTALVSVQILTIYLLLRSPFVILHLRVELIRREDGTLSGQHFLSL